MSKARLVYGVVGTTLWCLGASTGASTRASAVELPAGTNSAFVARTCGACHDLDMVVDAAGQTREGWNGTIDEMVGYGLSVTPADRAMLLDYLTSALGPDAKKAR
jgi:hypothetical protein